MGEGEEARCAMNLGDRGEGHEYKAMRGVEGWNGEREWDGD
jgi:hypothetical protein